MKEFENAKNEYNEKQIRNDRKIDNYFHHVSADSKSDLACEIIIELGDKLYWDKKDKDFKKRMTSVYKEQVKDLEMLVPSFKISSAIIHYDETSPHMHIVGVPVKKGNKNGMSKKVGKSKVFTKDSLRIIQDKMRAMCIEAFNNEYHLNLNLKQKKKGRNKDKHISEMDNHMELIKEIEENEKYLIKANEKTDKVYKKSNETLEIINKLKSTKINKNNYLLTKEQKENLEVYINEVKNNIEIYKGLNKFVLTTNKVRKDLEEQRKTIEIYQEKEISMSIKNEELKKQIQEKDEHIEYLEDENYNLRDKVRFLKKKLEKVINLFKERLFIRSKRNPAYEEVLEDFKEKEILTNAETEKIYERDYEKY